MNSHVRDLVRGRGPRTALSSPGMGAGVGRLPFNSDGGVRSISWRLTFVLKNCTDLIFASLPISASTLIL